MTKDNLLLLLELEELDTSEYLKQDNYITTQEYLHQYYSDALIPCDATDK